MALAGLWENWRSPAVRVGAQLRGATQSDAGGPGARDMAGLARGRSLQEPRQLKALLAPYQSEAQQHASAYVGYRCRHETTHSDAGFDEAAAHRRPMIRTR
jgi:hypothetical protein